MRPFETHFLLLWAQAHSRGFLTPRPSHDFPVSRPEQASGGPTLTITGKSWTGILECGVGRNLEKIHWSFFDILYLKMCPFEAHFLILWAQAHSKGFLAPKPSHDFPVTRPEQAPGGPTLTITGKSWAGILECGVGRNLHKIS